MVEILCGLAALAAVFSFLLRPRYIFSLRFRAGDLVAAKGSIPIGLLRALEEAAHSTRASGSVVQRIPHELEFSDLMGEISKERLRLAFYSCDLDVPRFALERRASRAA